MNDMADEAYNQMCDDAMAEAEQEHYKGQARDLGKRDLMDIIINGRNAQKVIMARKNSGMARVYFLAYCEGMHGERQRQNAMKRVWQDNGGMSYG